LTKDLSDPEVYEQTYRELTAPSSARGSVPSFAINPSIYSKPDTELIKLQKEQFDVDIIDAVDQAVTSDEIKSDPEKVRTLLDAKGQYGKSPQATKLLQDMFGRDIVDSYVGAQSEIPAYRGVEQNPYFRKFLQAPEVADTQPLPTPSMATSPDGRMPVEQAIELLMSDPQKYSKFFQETYPEVDINNLFNTPRVD
jgi:hypothetical protein